MVARTVRGGEVAGSNPVIPTRKADAKREDAAMAFIDIRLEFEEVEEDGETYLEFSSISRTDTDFTNDQLNSNGESWAQSDFWQVGVNNAFGQLIGDSKVDMIDVDNIKKMW